VETRIDIYFDGACHNKKDSKQEPFGSGVAVFIGGEYSSIYSTDNICGLGTSNIAEWEGCLESLRIAKSIIEDIKDINAEERYALKIYSDSQLIVKQFNEEYITKDPVLRTYYEKSLILRRDSFIHEIYWVPREKNTVADKLSKQALEKQRITNNK
jgi:ribonuclease HI